LLNNSPIIIDAEIKPVEIFDYENCVKEMDVFAINLVKYADISLATRLIRELYKKLPGMFPEDASKIIRDLINNLENKENKNIKGEGLSG